MSGDRLLIETGRRLSLSTGLSIECNDALFLGEVISCRQRENETFEAQIKVEQILTGLQSLIGLRARLLGEGVPRADSANGNVPVWSRSGHAA